ncbi:MAG TPA: AraC family ligand binding domain-containing protein [Pseudonocardiaceae bacterium]|nr:AraC family ligand binding domain-containing protein [Pseudonocardiaceae bacterium]
MTGNVRVVRPVVEFITPGAGRAWAFQVRTAPDFPFAWHAHDYYELTVITAGTGRRFAGDAAAAYGPGDVALFGPRLPHTYAAAAAHGPQSACVAQLSAAFVDRLTAGPEFVAVRELLARSGHGVALSVPSSDLSRSALRLAELDGARQTVALLELLTDLAEQPSLVTLASTAAARSISATSADALSAVVSYWTSTTRSP